MNWQAWVLVAFFVVNVLSSILIIGMERKPITPGTAAVMVLISGFLVWCVFGAVGAT